MDSNSTPGALQARFSPVWKVEIATPEAKAPGKAEAPVAEVQRPAPAELTSADALIEIDKAAGRFVTTIVDSKTDEVLRKYPSETQLAYSRAVSAYLKALSEKL